MITFKMAWILVALIFVVVYGVQFVINWWQGRQKFFVDEWTKNLGGAFVYRPNRPSITKSEMFKEINALHERIGRKSFSEDRPEEMIVELFEHIVALKLTALQHKIHLALYSVVDIRDLKDRYECFIDITHHERILLKNYREQTFLINEEEYVLVGMIDAENVVAHSRYYLASFTKVNKFTDEDCG